MLVGPDGREYEREDVDKDVLRAMAYDTFGMSKEAAEAFTDWGDGLFGAWGLG